MKYEIRSAGEPDEEDKGFEEKGNTEKQCEQEYVLGKFIRIVLTVVNIH